MQQNTIGGVLQPPRSGATIGDYQFKLIEYVEASDWVAARKLVCTTVPSEDMEQIFRFMYENIHKSPKYAQKDKWEEAIITIADHLYKHTLVADPEINIAAMFIKLSQ